ncbi:aspartate aminotransferase family protein [Streptomyces sp. NPDC058045]|uniref:aspartate aminotransferase family protein n=1 Tax=Streptomyces sp. NPDC058045 TaxID=3346311 RepID=UPI0036F0EC1B
MTLHDQESETRRRADTEDAEDQFAGSRAHRLRARSVLPLGVSSSPRSTQLPVPLAVASAREAHLVDVDGNTFVDYAMGYGPLILGHSPQPVLDAVRAELADGLRTGSVHRGEADLAEAIAGLVPGAELTSFVSSGTEAVHLALRVARAATGRPRVLKFRGHYHGWFDGIHLANAPGVDGATTAGQDPDALRNVTVLDWGDTEALRAHLSDDVAAVIMEPAAVNAGCFAPPPGFLEEARQLTRSHGALLVFDEVITGFRLALGGAQERFGVTPDLTVLGKALGAGMPISAVSGSTAAMAPISSGTVMHRGTFNGNPVSVAAALACLRYLESHAEELYPRMEGQAGAIAAQVRAAATRYGVEVAANSLGGTVQLFAGTDAVPTIAALSGVDRERTLSLTQALLRRGVQTLPRGLMYLSSAHTDEDLALTLDAIDGAIGSLAGKEHLV